MNNNLILLITNDLKKEGYDNGNYYMNLKDQITKELNFFRGQHLIRLNNYPKLKDILKSNWAIFDIKTGRFIMKFDYLDQIADYLELQFDYKGEKVE